MKLIDLKNDLMNLLFQACLDHLNLLLKDLAGKSVFSYTIYCSSGCRNMGVAVCTREGLKLRDKKIVDTSEPSWYAEVNGAEWDYINLHYEKFDKVDDLIEKVYSIFYDGELDDIDLDSFDDDELWEFISNFFTDIIIKTLEKLKMSNYLSDELFENDLLLGVQFGDPDEYVLDMIENTSKKLNSETWHNKIMMNLDLLKG